MYAVNYNHCADIYMMRTQRVESDRRKADRPLPSTLTLGTNTHVPAPLVRILNLDAWGSLLQFYYVIIIICFS